MIKKKKKILQDYRSINWTFYTTNKGISRNSGSNLNWQGIQHCKFQVKNLKWQRTKFDLDYPKTQGEIANLSLEIQSILHCLWKF